MEDNIKIDTESIKIEKNSKGFNYEFKLIGKVEDQISRISVLNERIKEELAKTKIDS
jgi:hypothetical protein